MAEWTDHVLGVRASTADLVQGLAAEPWTDADIAAPSLCEGWTRGHVLTHLARNADGIAATLSGALRGEIVARYPDGWDARNAAIDAGAGRPLSAQLTDVRESAERLDRVIAAVHDASAWDRPTDHDHPASDWLGARWREVEIHRVDLAGDYTPDRWPPAFVTMLLGDVLETVPGRAGTPISVTVTADGSLAGDWVDRSWSTGDAGTGVEVRGPDWAVLAWAIGRGAAAEGALTAAPPLAEWR